MRITLAGEEVHLLSARALWWPGGRAVFTADPHFGKAAVFRASGVPVPDSAMARDLLRLSHLIDSTGATRLVILGDFLHARDGRDAATFAALGAWRARHQRLEVCLVRGNHDRHAGDPPEDLGINAVDGPHRDGPFLLLHEPDGMRDPSDAGYRLAGHAHPVAVLRDGAGGHLRLPCFHQQPGGMTLPAFGLFTGGARISARADDHVYLIGPDSVVAAGIESDETKAPATNFMERAPVVWRASIIPSIAGGTMHIQVNAGDVELSPAIEEHVNVEVGDSLSRFADQITRVEVHLRDLNGPKQGLDKRCMVEVRLAGHDPLAVEHDAENLYDAVKEAAGKAARAIQRYLERHEERLTGR